MHNKILHAVKKLPTLAKHLLFSLTVIETNYASDQALRDKN